MTNIILLRLLVFASVFAEQDGWDELVEELENVTADEGQSVLTFIITEAVCTSSALSQDFVS